MSGTGGAPFGDPRGQVPHGGPELPPRGASGAPASGWPGSPLASRPAGARRRRVRAHASSPWGEIGARMTVPR